MKQRLIWQFQFFLILSQCRVVLFRTMRSRDHEVVVVRRTINLGYWEFGMGREWGEVEKGEVSLRVT
jgi:hypothetical protein